MKKLFVVFALVAMALLLGCTANDAMLSAPKNDPAIKEFLTKYPNAEITSEFLKASAVKSDSDFTSHCLNVEAADCYKVTFYDSESGALAFAFVNDTNVICAYKKEGETLPPSGCIETWTCSTWEPGTCGEGRMQSRTCNDSAKCGTTKSKPAEEQECIYVQPTPCQENWTCGDWTTCSNSLQTRTCIDANGCGTSLKKPVLAQNCMPGCTEKWVCSSWNDCSNNLQTRTCNDANNCGTNLNHPATSQSCSGPCKENWSCGSWGTCGSNSLQSRACTDSNSCGTDVNKPVISQSCVYYAENELRVGQSISVAGAGSYTGKTLTIDLNAIVLVSSTYEAKWILKDGSTPLIYVQKAPTYDLRDEFGTDYMNLDHVQVLSIDSNKLSVTYHKLNNPLEIRNNEVFPYDSSQTTNPQWKGYLTSNGSAITSIAVKNNWSYNQSVSETSSSKFMLAKDANIDLPQGYIKVKYKGLETKTTTSSTIGGDNLLVTDGKGVQRTLPLVISLSQGSNTFQISGSTYFADVNPSLHKMRYWKNPASSMVDPWNSPAGTLNVDYFDITYATRDVASTAAGFNVDSDWLSGNVEYYLGGDDTTSQYWLFLGAQDFAMPSVHIYFDGTYLTDSDLRNYYLPDQSTYNVLANEGLTKTPDEGDSFSFTGKFRVSDEDDVSVFVNTSTGLLVNSTDGKSRYSQADCEAKHASFSLNEYSYSAATRLKQGYTSYGTKISVNAGAAQITAASSKTYALIGMTKGATDLGDSQQGISVSGSATTSSKTITSNSSYSESLSVTSAPMLQTIATGTSPGEILLKTGSQGINYFVTFASPLNYDSSPYDINGTITFLGKTYDVLQISATRILLEEQ